MIDEGKKEFTRNVNGITIPIKEMVRLQKEKPSYMLFTNNKTKQNPPCQKANPLEREKRDGESHIRQTLTE